MTQGIPVTQKLPWKGAAAYALVFALWLAAVAWYAHSQKPVTYNGGLGWDGERYALMYGQARRGEHFTGEKPFVYRVATPWLAAHLGAGDPRLAFHIVNLGSVLLTGWLLLALMRALGARGGVSVFLVALYFLQWHAPLRQQFYDSFGVDAASQPFILGLFLVHLRARRPGPRYAALSALTLIGVFFRESVIFGALAVWLAERARAARGPGWKAALLAPAARVSALPLLAGVSGIAATHLLATGIGRYGFLVTILYYLYHKPLAVLVHSLYNGYGTALMPVLVFWRRAWDRIRREPLLGIYPLIAFGLSWTAGEDTTRIDFWGCLAMLPLMALVLSDLRLFTFGILPFLLLEAVCTRMAWPFPDYPGYTAWRIPWLTNWGSDFPYFDLWSELANPRVLMISLFQYLALTAACVFWIRLAGPERYLRPEARSPGEGLSGARLPEAGRPRAAAPGP